MVELTCVVVCCVCFSFVCLCVSFDYLFLFMPPVVFYCSWRSTGHLRIQLARFEFTCLFCVFSLFCCCAFVFLFVFHVFCSFGVFLYLFLFSTAHLRIQQAGGEFKCFLFFSFVFQLCCLFVLPFLFFSFQATLAALKVEFIWLFLFLLVSLLSVFVCFPSLFVFLYVWPLI